MTATVGEQHSNIYDYGLHWRRAIVISVTKRCPLTCAHCTVESGPHRTEEMPLEQALSVIDALGADPEVELVVFSGGEPFLKLSRLRQLLEAVKRNGLKVDIVTSSHWAVNPDRALSILGNLPPITHLSLSADKYHLPFVPLDRVRNAAEAALSLGIGVGAYLVIEGDNDDFTETFRTAMGSSLLRSIEIQIERVHCVGRARSSGMIRNAIVWTSFDNLPELRCEMPATPAIREDGRVMACCGDTMSDPENWQPLMLGNLNDEPLHEILDRAGRNTLVHVLRLFGPKALGRIANERAGRQHFVRLLERDNICDVCRAVITNPEIFREVRAFLAEPETVSAIAALRMLHYGEVDGRIVLGTG